MFIVWIYCRRLWVSFRQRVFCVNLDCTVVAEVPKLALSGAMQVNLAEVLGITPQRVNVKFTTSEGLGFIGEKRGSLHMLVVY